MKKIRIALVGNPNSGKTTLFNALTGAREYTGNRAGVTVDQKSATLKNNPHISAIDLPGIYSLCIYSPEERATLNCLIYDPPDIIVNVVDATALKRNLYLTTQLTELGIPMVIALNMIDEAEKNGELPDIPLLSETLGCEVTAISAINDIGLSDLIKTIIHLARSGNTPDPPEFCGCVEHTLQKIGELLTDIPPKQKRQYAVRLFERNIEFSRLSTPAIEHYIELCEIERSDRSDSMLTSERYLFIDKLIKRCCRFKKKPPDLTHRLDKIFADGIPALFLFAVIISAVYFVSITLTSGLCNGMENITEFLRIRLDNALFSLGCYDWLRAFITDGIISGVGSVLNFIPQLFVLFLLLAFLEECGYMSRIAFILDRLFRQFGMSGKSVIPLIIGSGCSAVGITSSRTIENDKSRRMSIITTSFIPCSAKLPLISLISSTVFDGEWWVAPKAYFIGKSSVLLSGLIIKSTKPFKSDSVPFIMELPSYRLPDFGGILHTACERSMGFVKKAGTVILLSSTAIQSALMLGFSDGRFLFSTELSPTESIIGIFCEFICPVFAPLGFGETPAIIATIMGIVAKEEIVAVLGITGFSGFTPLSGFSFMVFNLLCPPCIAAISAIHKEMNSAKWTLFAVLYQTSFAYLITLLIYQGGRLI